MRSRTFAVLLIGLAGLLFAATVIANLVIDPQGVFATGYFPDHPNPNSRYLHFLAYRREAAQVDALLFASSRGGAFDRDVLARRMGVHRVADFSYPFGLLSDHLPFLEYVLRDKAGRKRRLTAVLLVLDVDHFGKAPWTNRNIDSMLPPAVSGEAALAFWWRYLTAFQFRNWRVSLRSQLRGHKGLASGGEPEEQANPAHGAPPRPDFRQQLALLRRFSRACRENAVALTVVISPLSLANAQRLDADELRSVVAEIAKIVAVWDFSAPSPLGARADLWLDQSHYGPAIGTMMLDRMYLGQGDVGRQIGD
jgi:hypothetical protein